MDYRHVNIGVDNAPDEAEALFHLLLAGHKTIYDRNALEKVLIEAGFENIATTIDPFDSLSDVIKKQTIPMYPSLSLYVEAEKTQDITVEKSEHPSMWSGMIVYSPKNAKRGADLERLKIGIISTPMLRTPPDGYGGLELIVANLAETLASMGHDVTVFAADGSKIPGCRIVEFGPPKMKVQVDWVQAERDAYNVYKNMLDRFDIINGHNWFGFEYSAKNFNNNLKICHTHHGGLNMEWWGRSRPPFKLNMIAISKWMTRVYSASEFNAKHVYNGINLGDYQYQEEKGDRLLFVGRIDKFKQPHVAVEVARRLDMGLDIVGGTFIQDPSYLEQIRSMCDGKSIVFHPDAPHETKVELMRNAKCLIFPSKMGEPFGLVPVESMVCGTPVVALNDGAVEEVVVEGGLICDVFDKKIMQGRGPVYVEKTNAVESIMDAVGRIGTIKPERCRMNAERFSKENMAENYLKLYKTIIEGNEW